MQFARIYRDYTDSSNYFKFNITIKESDLFIISDKVLKKEAYLELLRARKILETHIKEYPEFLTSLKPLKVPNNTPDLLKKMYLAGKRAKVGPFASVAGAVAEYVGKNLKKLCNEIIVENGGDIYIDTKKDRIVRVYSNSLKNIGIKIPFNFQPVSVCSSSSKIGHSKSFGNAELVVVIAKDTAIADAFATSICNRIKKKDDLQIVLNDIREKKILATMAIINGKIAVKGKIEFVKLGD